MLNPLAQDLDHVLAHTAGVWDELRSGRLFLTGGTGFFGCWFLETFLWANEKLDLGAAATVLTRDAALFRARSPHLANHPAIRLHTGDVTSFVFPEGQFSHVIHAATDTNASLNRDRPLAMLDTIVQGTRRVLDFAVACGARKFLLTSSGAVYGKQPPELARVPETYTGAPDTMDPGSAYGESKRMAELLCAIYRQSFGIETKIARCFAFVGPYMQRDAHFAIGNFIRDSLDGRPIHVKGDGTPFRSYLYAADLMIWLWTILSRGEPCRPYNVGSEEDFTIAEVASAVAAKLSADGTVTVAGTPEPGRGRERYVPCVSRAKSELHLSPRVTLSQAIRRTAEWHPDVQRKCASRLCPICGTSPAEVLHHQTFALPEQHPLAQGYDVVACRSCGFVYADTAVPQSAYDEFNRISSRYDGSQASTGAGKSSWDAERLSQAAERIARLIPSPSAGILDMGCANGGLLQALERLGYRKLVGIDPSPACVNNTRSRGVEAHVGSLSSIPAGLASFDCVILSHVLEHVQDLRGALANLRPLIEEQTIVYIEVPDATRYIDFCYSPYQDFNTEHINHFSTAALDNLLMRVGYCCRTKAQITIRASAVADYPALWGTYQIAKQSGALPAPTYDDLLEVRIRQYIQASSSLMSELDRRLTVRLAGATSVILWGTGQLAVKLLQQTCLTQVRIAACVDSNAIHQGRQFAGAPVLKPQQITGMNEPIVICTLLHTREIAEKIRSLGLPNQIISLETPHCAYDNSAASEMSL